jgi:hypothetical protein
LAPVILEDLRLDKKYTFEVGFFDFHNYLLKKM